MEFMHVPAGKFLMGSDPGNDDEKPLEQSASTERVSEASSPDGDEGAPNGGVVSPLSESLAIISLPSYSASSNKINQELV